MTELRLAIHTAPIEQASQTRQAAPVVLAAIATGGSRQVCQRSI